MLFSRENIDTSMLCFREQIISSQEIPFNKLATIDCLYSAIFFSKEVGAIKALANNQLVNSHFTIPKSIEEFKKRGCNIALDQLKEIIFNSLAPVFNDVEPSSIGFSHCNQTDEGFYWLQHYASHKSWDEGSETGHLGLMHTSGFCEVHSLAGHKDEYPRFDVETAKLYCRLFNNSMGLDLNKLPNFDHQRGVTQINKSAYASIFKSAHIRGELSKLVSSNFTKILSQKHADLFDENSLNLTYKDYLELVINDIEVNNFANIVEEIISMSLWQIKEKFYLLGNTAFSDSLAIEPFYNSMLLKITIPSRVDYLEEKLDLNCSIIDFIEAVTMDSLEDSVGACTLVSLN